MQKILGIGNALIDILIQVSDDSLLRQLSLPKGSTRFVSDQGYPRLSAAIAHLQRQITAGGSASNTAKGLSMLGTPAGYIGKVGNDDYGRLFCNALETHGVTPFLTVHPKAPTGLATTLITPDGQRTFADYMGAASLLEPADIDHAPLDDYDMLYVEGYLVQSPDLIEHAMSQAKAHGLRVCLDLSSYNIVETQRPLFQHLLHDYVDTVFANEEEAAALTGGDAEASATLMARFCQTAVVKLGARGAIACSQGQCYRAPSLSVAQVIDTTGAGDSFAAGFLHARANGWPLDQALSLGNRIASHVIQHIGSNLPAAEWHQLKASAGDA